MWSWSTWARPKSCLKTPKPLQSSELLITWRQKSCRARDTPTLPISGVWGCVFMSLCAEKCPMATTRMILTIFMSRLSPWNSPFLDFWLTTRPKNSCYSYWASSPTTDWVSPTLLWRPTTGSMTLTGTNCSTRQSNRLYEFNNEYVP